MAHAEGTRGGARPGAGRPRREEKYARPIAAAEKRIADRLPELLDNLFDLAAGVTVADVGTGTVYARPPDRQANEYLVNRIMGKPVERQEHDIDAEIAELLALLAAQREETTT